MLEAIDIHKAVDIYTAAQFPDVPVVYANQDETTLAEGNISWLKQKVVFREANQFELGNVDSARQKGVVVFIIYVRKGSGSLDRDTLYQRVLNSFRSKQIGGATFLNVQPMLQGGNENWSLTGLQIPFYFNSI